uniref:peroxidase n=1 Tax=Kalanchoe fedtschenkoi TaxID=63787 RepID=A0A7N0ZY25_KALFE
MSPSFSPSLLPCILLAALLLVSTDSAGAVAAPATRRHRQLSVSFYAKTCPDLNQLVSSVTSQQFRVSPATGPRTIRLFFHDCFVDGCDGSILISSKPGGAVAERDAVESKYLAEEAFVMINKAKALVESKCPGIVSCADILALSARDFVHLAGGPYYDVKVGRWDGKLSMATRIGSNLPRANSTMAELISLFASKGLTLEDLC